MKRRPLSIPKRNGSSQQSLAELAENRTTLVIAHRLATIRDADRVIVVTEDGIAEDGKYDELVNRVDFCSRCIIFNSKRFNFYRNGHTIIIPPPFS